MEKTKFYRYWIQLILGLTFLQYGLYYYVHKSNILNMIDDVLIVLLFINISFINYRKQTIFCSKSKYDFLFIILILLAFFSAILNQIPLLNFIIGIKSYFLYFLFFYCIYWINFSEEDTEKIIKFSLNIFILELLVVIIQFINAISSNKLTGDSIFGTFNGANFFGYAIFVLLYFSCYQYLFHEKREYLKFVIILLIMLLMSSARFAILLFPFVFLLLNLKKIFLNLGLKKIIIIILLILLIPILVNNTFMFKDGKIQDYFTVDFVKNHFSNTENRVTSGSARNLWYPVTREYLEEYSYNPLIGFGPGMYASYTAMRFMPYTNTLIYNHFNQEALGLDPEVDSQIIPIWGELGYLGIIIFYALLIFMFIRMIFINRKTKTPFIKALSSTAAAYCLFFIIGFYIHHILESQTTAILLFLFVGFTENQYRLMKIKKHKKNSNENIAN